VPFALFYLREPLKLDYLRAGLCILGAVPFIFRSWWVGDWVNCFRRHARFTADALGLPQTLVKRGRRFDGLRPGVGGRILGLPFLGPERQQAELTEEEFPAVSIQPDYQSRVALPDPAFPSEIEFGLYAECRQPLAG